MIDYIIILILIFILSFVIGYIFKAKKRGEKCIGCPNSRECAKKKLDGGCSHL